MMTSEALNSMYAQIVNGGTKEDSRFVTDDESSALWDTISREVAEMREANPDGVFSIPNEMPDPDDEDTEEPDAEPTGGDGQDTPADDGETPPAEEPAPPEEGTEA